MREQEISEVSSRPLPVERTRRFTPREGFHGIKQRGDPAGPIGKVERYAEATLHSCHTEF